MVDFTSPPPITISQIALMIPPYAEETAAGSIVVRISVLRAEASLWPKVRWDPQNQWQIALWLCATKSELLPCTLSTGLIFILPSTPDTSRVSIVKPTKCTNVSNLFYVGINLHVSEGFSVHHQEFTTVHTATGICQTPDDGRKDRRKHVECHSKIK